MDPHRLKTFVANRVAKIQGITWGHVLTTQNPANILSRGSSAMDLQHNSLWWQGPIWLTDSESGLPEDAIVNEEKLIELPEVKIIATVLEKIPKNEVLLRYSSYDKLCRVIAYCCRFVSLARSPQLELTGPLQTAEVQHAEEIILKWTQQEAFGTEIRLLEDKAQLPKGQIMHLTPFLDQHELLLVGGRLNNAQIPEEQKHQILLSANSHVTTILMRAEHHRLGHFPPGQFLHSIRQRYWPVNGRREATKIVKGCMKCFRFNPSVPPVLMGSLPEERTRMFTRPFAITGVDYAGPFQLRESKRRGRIHVSKAYVAVFVCFSTKAVHLELLSELSSDAFLAALNRFTARRGICGQIFSDNGTNFVGAARALKELQEFSEDQ